MTSLSSSPVTVVRVKDTFCGVRGKYEEECVTTDNQEAAMWFKQWSKEYDKESGYKVSKKVYPEGLPENFAYSL